jgi:hypothetical protein
LFDGIPRRAKIAGRADERADFLRLKSVFYPACDPVPNRLRLLFPVIESLDRRNAARTGAARLRGRLARTKASIQVGGAMFG